MSNVQTQLPTDAESVGTSYLGWVHPNCSATRRS